MTQLVHLNPEADPDRWNALALTVPGGTGFHEWSFLDLAERLTGLTVERFLVVTDRPVGILPLVRRAPGSPMGEWMPFPFLGPAVPPELLADTLHAVRRWQWRHGPLLARLDIAPALAPMVRAAAAGAGMDVEEDSTMVLDLSHGSVDEMYARMDAKRRQHIRASERKGVSSRPALPGETAAMLGPSVSAAYRRHGASSPYPDDVGAQFEEWAAGRDDVLHVSALVRGQHAGSLTVLGWHPTAIGWIGAALPEFRSSRPSDLMYRDAFAWAIERGHRLIDTAGRVDDEVQSYKRSFGAVQAPYARLVSLLGPPGLGTAAKRLRRARAGRERLVQAERSWPGVGDRRSSERAVPDRRR